MSQPQPANAQPGPFTILFKETKNKIEGLTIEGVIESKHDETSIVFLTKARKPWKVRLSEFSFIFASTAKKVAEVVTAQPETPATVAAS